jgi:hypothetical protein
MEPEMSEHETEKVVNKRQFVALVKLSDQTKTKTAELTGTFGERVKKAVEDGHLHAGAFRIICRMNRMEETKRNDFERALLLYLDFGRELLWGDDDHAGDLVDDAEREAQEDPEAAKKKADAAASKKNAKALNEGIRPLESEEEKIARQKAEDDQAFAKDVAAQKARVEGSPKVVGFPGAPADGPLN